MMESEKRLLIAIALSILVILGYQAYMNKYYKPHKIRTVEPAQLPNQTLSIRPDEDIEESPSGTEETTTIENELYRAVLTNNGAAIKELYLVEFKDKKGEPTPLLLGKEKGLPLILEIDNTLEPEREKWQLVQTADGTITYRAEDAKKTVEKKFKFHNSIYIIELELIIQNKTAYPQQIRYKIINGPMFAATGHADKRYMGVDTQIGEKVFRRTSTSKTIQGGELFYGTPAWVSTRGKYFSLVLRPEQADEAAFIESRDKKNAWSGIILGPVDLEANGVISRRYTMYAGPNDTNSMAVIGAASSNIISYGMFGGIAKLLFRALIWLYNIFGNYGVAIMMLALIITAIVFPLTRKSLRSMKEMQKIQPEAERLRKEYSANPQKMNKEIMDLYKKHNINPLGGCLPMLLQLPIFFSLYQVLLRSVELKGANFLWIKDLSEPDAFYIPFIQKSINLLPILMAIAMFIQQKISHPGGEISEQQRMMAIIMPVMLGVIFYNLASGLVLYWFTNTILTLVVQEVILKSRKQA